MVKEYVAKVHGTPPEQGDWEDLLWKDSRKNKVFVVKRMRGGVKAARLEFQRLRTEEDTSLVRIRLHTGRSHQIRVQFASRGFPLVGDHKNTNFETAPRCRCSIPAKSPFPIRENCKALKPSLRGQRQNEDLKKLHRKCGAAFCCFI